MNELIERYSGKICREFSDDQFDAYELNNGCIILEHKFLTSAFLWDIDDYRKANGEMLSRSPIPRPILSTFQREIGELKSNGAAGFLEKLSTRLEFKVDPMNKEEDYLLKVSEAINRYLQFNNRQDIYFAIVVFIGEHVKHRVNGQWIFQPNNVSENVQEVFVTDSHKRIYNPWLGVYKKINEGETVYLNVIIKDIVERLSLPTIKN